MGRRRKSGLVAGMATLGKPGSLHKSKKADADTHKITTFELIHVATCVIPRFNIILNRETISWVKFASSAQCKTYQTNMFLTRI